MFWQRFVFVLFGAKKKGKTSFVKEISARPPPQIVARDIVLLLSICDLVVVLIVEILINFLFIMILNLEIRTFIN